MTMRDRKRDSLASVCPRATDATARTGVHSAPAPDHLAAGSACSGPAKATALRAPDPSDAPPPGPAPPQAMPAPPRTLPAPPTVPVRASLLELARHLGRLAAQQDMRVRGRGEGEGTANPANPNEEPHDVQHREA